MAMRAAVRSVVLIAVLSATAAAIAASAWSPVGPPGGAVYGLSIDPKDANILYAGTFGGGVWKSKDGGATWTRLSGVPVDETVNAVAVSPADSRIILAGSSYGLYRSADAGATWKRVLDQGKSQPAMTGFAFDPSKPATVYASSDSDGHPAGVFKSTDGGATWNAANGGISGNSRVWSVAVARKGTAVWASSSDGIYQSNDGGATWALSNEGIDTRSVLSFAAQPSAPRTFLVGTREGAYRSTDNGASWTHVLKGSCEPEVQHLRFAPSNAKRVWAHSGRDFCQLARSDDGGLTWKEITTPRPDSSMRGHFAFHLNAKSPDQIAFSTDRHLHLSSDGGATWSEATGIPPTSRVQDIVTGKTPEELFAATNEGIYRSADGGKTWTAAGAENVNVRRLLFDAASGTIWAGAWKGILRSTDDGKTWSRIGGDPPHPDVVALALESPKALLVGLDGGGVFRLDVANATTTPLKAKE